MDMQINIIKCNTLNCYTESRDRDGTRVYREPESEQLPVGGGDPSIGSSINRTRGLERIAW